MGKCDEANVEVSMGDSASPAMKPDNFSFTPPPEAPVFEPTPEEFLDPLAYISKIRPIAEKSGICKIKPPAHWQPPFAVDVDRLRFTPRIQRLNELEAITRVKLNFLDQIIKFWELQGSVLKIPTVERKPLDLYALHKIVKEAGGFEVCSAERKWSKVARRMGFPQGKGIGSILKNHYEKILYRYDVFKNNGAVDNKDTKIEVKGEQTPEKAGGARSRSTSKCTAAATPPPARRFKPDPDGPTPSETVPADRTPLQLQEEAMKTPVKEENPETRRSPRENKWMSAAGSCGARSRVTRSTRLREHRMSNMTVSVTPAPPSSHALHPDDPLAKYMCHVCGRGDVEEQMLLCDGCDDSYHTFCLLPPLADVPKGDWRCPVCLAEEVSKPTEAFGFEQASREYTLQQFGEMADQFKSDYFNMPVHMVPTSTVEKEFWRVVSSIDEDVTVEYGADLHSMDHGSGFPTKSHAQLYPGEQQYAESSWNLNNLPVLEGSVLGHINADISGMKIPWLYVGMCFATFCWHNEDHWSYSINYLHWGEPKTWYGVPSSKAEQFEAAMKAEAPELFQLQPDLLHQLVTIMNPNVLMKAGVPVYRMDQHAGEFVITFPRAYHAGFNQGYNFAEAVNFTPADWLKMGRECIAHYSTLRRNCVFSHDELVCKMALTADTLSLTVALAAYRDMRTMLHDERKLRKGLLDWGVTEAEREAFELLPDDERQCQLCKTTCFLSCVTCACTPHVACLRHYTQLCDCPAHKHKLRYRYTLDELPAMLEKLKKKSEQFREWAEAVQNALDPDTPKTCDLDGLRAHLKRAHDLKMHKTELVRALETAIEDAEKCASVIQQLDLNKMRTRTRQHDPKYRLTIHELTLFAAEIDGLACVLPEGSAVKEVLRQTSEFETRATELLNKDLDKTDQTYVRELEETSELGSRLCIVLPALPALQARLAQVRFLEEVRTYREDCSTLTRDVIQRLLNDADSVVPHHRVEMERSLLYKLKAQVEEWESRARAVLIDTSKNPLPDEEPQYTTLAELDALLADGEDIDAALPSYHALQTAVSHARDWLGKVEEMQSKELYPYMHSVESIVKKGQQIPLQLYEKHQLAQALQSARDWQRGAADMFLKQNWQHSLLEALSPRVEAGAEGGRRRGRAGEAWLEAGLFLRNFSEDSTPTDIVAAFKHAEQQELHAIKELRARNLRKEVRAPVSAGVTFCTCQKRQYGVMTQCELCKDWFHEPQYTTLAELDALLADGEDIDAALPSYHALQTAVSHARDWLGKVEEMQSKELYPYMHSVESIVKKGQQIPLQLYEKHQLAQALQSARDWQRGAADMFLKQNWQHSLLEALSPRVEAGAEGGRRRGRAGEAWLEAGLFLRNFSEDSTPTDIVAAFKHAEQQELHAIKELRARNLRKEVRAPVSAGVTFCTCQKRQYGVMTQCELCKDWFHASCIAASKEDREESPERVEVPFPNTEPKFLCSDCMRTKRPRLDRILALLVWLQKLPVRLAEGEALQCVTERAMAWQDAARALLASPLLAALPALPALACSREKADKLNAELKKATGRAHDSHNAQNARSSASVEHAYSATPRSPSARVAPGLLQKLEDLMLEGDLLEVRLEEQASVWGAGVSSGSGLMMRKHYMARQERRKRGLAATTRGKHPRQTRMVSSGSGLMMRKHYMARQERRKRGLAATTRGKHPRQTRMVSSGSGLMMRKHYMARQERRKRGLAATTRGKHPRQTRMVSSGSGLMMRKHYMARQERRKRGLAATTRGKHPRQTRMVSSGSGLMMRKHYMARQERRKRGLAATTRGKHPRQTRMVSSGSGLMMRKHYMARQERRKRGLAATTRGKHPRQTRMVSSGSGLMMRKHYMARQERRKRGLAATTRGKHPRQTRMVSSGSGLMMRKHYMARQERRKRGLAATTRGKHPRQTRMVSSGSGLMMRKHYMARQERRKRGLAATTRGKHPRQTRMVSSGSGLMMRKHYMARQERRKRGLAATTRGKHPRQTRMVSSGSGLMMRKHYMARQERRKRGLAATTRGKHPRQTRMVSSGSGLMMRKHYMARQERRKRGLAATTRGKHPRQTRMVSSGSGLMMRKHYMARQERRKRGLAATTRGKHPRQTRMVSSGSGLMMRKHYMARQERRKRGLAATTRGKHPRQTRMAGARAAAGSSGAGRAAASSARRSSSSSASSAEDDEDCAAHNCLRPTGKVDWVQCDGGCDQWFHMHCVGLSRAALRDDDDYVCGTCAQGPQ
uniref:[histone H3]-trimethyl-L-lysine(4) demethylase n=1 Tax=Heliothis virescens TaxID=7102 RepID=A0A2A4JRQ2_HELVI